MIEAKSEGGANGAAPVDPVGGFFLGFGRGFLGAGSGSARVSPLDVEATALSVMVAVVGGSRFGGSTGFGGRKGSGGMWRTLRITISGEGGSQGKRANLLNERGIPRLQSPERGRPESFWVCRVDT